MKLSPGMTYSDLKKEEELEKVLTSHQEHLASFIGNIGDPYTRKQLHESLMSPKHAADRRKMIDALASEPSVKTKTLNGKRHFLLHRGMSKEESKYGSQGPTAYSWSKGIASTFAAHYGGKVHSRWVPEDAISYSDHHAHLVSKRLRPPSDADEKEVLVDASHPGIHPARG